MSETTKRIFSFTMAMVFLGTVVLGGLLVLWQISQDKKQAENATNDQTITDEENLEVEDPNKLQGTELENFEPVQNVDELKTVDIKQGDGQVVEEGATVTAHYTGALAKNGIIFESSRDGGEPIEFPLSGVIQGWTQGVPGMKVGGVRRLVIPADLAYGEQGSPPAIGPNEPLVFDIELTDVKNP